MKRHSSFSSLRGSAELSGRSSSQSLQHNGRSLRTKSFSGGISSVSGTFESEPSLQSTQYQSSKKQRDRNNNNNNNSNDQFSSWSNSFHRVPTKASPVPSSTSSSSSSSSYFNQTFWITIPPFLSLTIGGGVVLDLAVFLITLYSVSSFYASNEKNYCIAKERRIEARQIYSPTEEQYQKLYSLERYSLMYTLLTPVFGGVSVMIIQQYISNGIFMQSLSANILFVIGITRPLSRAFEYSSAEGEGVLKKVIQVHQDKERNIKRLENALSKTHNKFQLYTEQVERWKNDLERIQLSHSSYTAVKSDTEEVEKNSTGANTAAANEDMCDSASSSSFSSDNENDADMSSLSILDTSLGSLKTRCHDAMNTISEMLKMNDKILDHHHELKQPSKTLSAANKEEFSALDNENAWPKHNQSTRNDVLEDQISNEKKGAYSETAKHCLDDNLIKDNENALNDEYSNKLDNGIGEGEYISDDMGFDYNNESSVEVYDNTESGDTGAATVDLDYQKNNTSDIELASKEFASQKYQDRVVPTVWKLLSPEWPHNKFITIWNFFVLRFIIHVIYGYTTSMPNKDTSKTIDAQAIVNGRSYHNRKQVPPQIEHSSINNNNNFANTATTTTADDVDYNEYVLKERNRLFIKNRYANALMKKHLDYNLGTENIDTNRIIKNEYSQPSYLLNKYENSHRTHHNQYY